MCIDTLKKNSHIGFLILRVGIGAMFTWHGYGKLAAGPDVWTMIGAAMSHVGINFGHQTFGLLAALSEFGGGICFLLGVFFRPACFFLFFTMVIASTMHLKQGDGLRVASHAIEAGILFLSFMFIGPGKCSLDEKYNLEEKLENICKFKK